MEAARLLGQGLDPDRRLTLPDSLAEVEARAEFVDQTDGLLFGDSSEDQPTALGRRLRELAQQTRELLPEVEGDLDRLSITLRIWAGCISAGASSASISS